MTTTTRSQQSTPSSAPVAGLPPYWAPDSFRANPTTVAIGQTITFSGAGCPAGAHAQVLGPVEPKEAIARSDRTWSETTVIPDESRIGAVPAFATCETGPTAAPAYTPITLNVTTYRHLDAQPSASVRPGSTLTLTAIGKCPDRPSNSVFVVLSHADHEAGGVMRTALVAKPDGNWSGPFTVPTRILPGSYFLIASCEGFRTTGVAYTPLPISVLGAN